MDSIEVFNDYEQIAEEDKVNVLLVDDNVSKLMTLEAILSEPGLNLIKATSGQEARAEASASHCRYGELPTLRPRRIHAQEA